MAYTSMLQLPALVEGWFPPSRENWQLLVYAWQFFPVFTAVQWLTDFYPQGKTSVESRFNLPGKLAWFLMEIPGVLTVWFCLLTIPPTVYGLRDFRDLPPGNLAMAGMFTIHYIYRAILSPLFLNPSMSPIHPLVFLSAAGWQVTNGLSIGGWVAGYGPTTREEWVGRLFWLNTGLFLWGWSFLGNIFHDDELREIRRSAARRQKKQIDQAKKEGKKADRVNVDKMYMMPQNGLFWYILYPHYLCEWLEWTGFWLVGGMNCIPAQSFVFNEISTMLPRALSGKRWYIEKFGEKEVAGRKAVIPGIL